MDAGVGVGGVYKYKTAFSAILAALMLNPATAHDQKQASRLVNQLRDASQGAGGGVLRALPVVNSSLPSVASPMEVLYENKTETNTKQRQENDTMTVKSIPVMPRPKSLSQVKLPYAALLFPLLLLATTSRTAAAEVVAASLVICCFAQACNITDLKATKACLPLLFTDHLQSMNY